MTNSDRAGICLILALLLTGCASVSGNIRDGNFSYQAKDVSINHFGINYSISLPMRVGSEDVTALTHATDCEKSAGTLQIKDKSGSELASYTVSTQGTSGADKIFKHLCELNPKLVRVMRGCS